MDTEHVSHNRLKIIVHHYPEKACERAKYQHHSSTLVFQLSDIYTHTNHLDFFMFVEVVASKLQACLTSVTKPLTQLHTALHAAASTAVQGHEPSTEQPVRRERPAALSQALCSLGQDHRCL